MIRQIKKRALPANAEEIFSAASGRCWIEIRPGDRKHTKSPAEQSEFVRCAHTLVRDGSVYLAIYREKSPAGALLTRALWYGGTVNVLAECGGAYYSAVLLADRSHIAGGIFSEVLVSLRQQNAEADIGAVWEMSVVLLEKLAKKPAGTYTQEEMDLFEIHLDHPSLKRQAPPKEALHPVTGCRVSLAPMSDDYISIILNAVGKVDTANVWASTDEFSTIYRGRRVHVLDALAACLIFAYRKGVHLTMTATVSRGCPGDRQMDAALQNAVWAEDDVPANAPHICGIHFPAAAKFALYPLGRGDYMELIAPVIDLAKQAGVYDRSAYYATCVRGDVQALLGYFDRVAEYCEQTMEHYVLEITFAVNFPEEA